jgi:Domain of unknown function (DUF4386)
MTSPKTQARIAGSLYLLPSVSFILALRIRSGIVKTGDAAATFDNIRSSAFLFRASIVIDLVSWACFLLTGLVLYVLLNHVHRLMAGAMVVFVVVLVAVGYLNDLNLYTALTIATNPAYAKAFGADASAALAMVFTGAYGNGLTINEQFFGLWLVPLGYLVIKSGLFPRLVGVLLIVAAVSWMGQFLADVLAPGLPYIGVIGQVLGAGELVFVAWLLIFGVRLPTASAPASAMAASSGSG